MLDAARELGIDTIDTAIAYGDSENCLGEVGVAGFKIVTKLPAQSDDAIPIDKWITSNLDGSLRRLRAESVYGLLLHRPELLHKDNATKIGVAINNAKIDGKISKFGVSIYDPAELDIVTKLINVDIVQAPFNVFDRRLEASGWLQRLYDAGVEVHIRSVYLQGLLLMPIEKLPMKFHRWYGLFENWHSQLQELNLEPIEACLASVNDHRFERVIIGVDNHCQLQQLTHIATKLDGMSFPDMQCNDINLINPSNWTKL